jgi:hypothetical protein
MDLTSPVSDVEIVAAFPRDTRGMAGGEGSELAVLLRLEERALRTQFGVTATDADTDAVLKDAMLAAWPSFIQQVRQEASVQATADGHDVTYNRAGVIDFTFPSFIGAMLRTVADPDSVSSAPSTTQLVR